MEPLCRIELLGGLRVWQGERLISRFRTHKVGALLAYLAYFPESPHSRETLMELLWPEAPPEAARNSLSNALSSLRHQLEPPGVPVGAVLQADRFQVGLRRAAIRTDAAEFEAHLQRAEQTANLFEQTQQWRQALELYTGPLLPGYYEEWILWEASRLTEKYLAATRRLVRSLAKSRQLHPALDYAHRAVALDPLHEQARRDLMRLLLVAEQPMAALQQYRDLETRLRQEANALPGIATQRLAQEIRQSLAASPAPILPSTDGMPETPTASPATGTPPASTPDSKPLIPTSQPPALDSSPHPTGTVTFLLLDTVPEEAMQEEQSPCVEARHSLLPILRRYGGYVFQEDAGVLGAVFQSAEEAVACAVACRRTFTEQETKLFPARMALHTGNVPTESESYQGEAFQYTASLLQAAHAGQTLCSEATGSLLRFACEPGVSLQNLGLFHLRGPMAVETLFQVNDLRTPADTFPPPRAVTGYESRLPLPLTRFLGREEERRRLQELLLLPQTRLVTLSGPGGIGKTRLAIETARHLTASFGGAVWFASLADLSDPALMADAILEALHSVRSPQLPVLAQVITELSCRPGLLILDNLEHLVEEAAQLVPALLEGVATLKCLVTSRRALEVGGEHEFMVTPLPTPAGAGTPEQLRFYESVQLFVDRAQSVKPDFQLTPGNAASLAQLCAGLEGIPLALELAATRAQVLSLSQMLSQLDRRFDLLVSRRRDMDARHRTLRATLDWSYQLLSEDLQRFFRCLSVFRGGWTLEAAEALYPTGASEEVGSVLDALAQLRENSLIVTAENEAGVRFGMLETLRIYGVEKLRESGEEERLRNRHRDYFLKFSEEAAGKQYSPEQADWLQRLALEHDNLRAALAWCEEQEAGAEAGLRLARALWWFWNLRGHFAEGRTHLERALARPTTQAQTAVRAEALNGAGLLARYQGDYTAAQMQFEEALALFRELGDQRGIAAALNNLGIAAYYQSDYRTARRLFEESLALRRETGDKQGIASSLSSLGAAAQAQGDYRASQALYEEALALFRQTGDKRLIANALHNLGSLAQSLSDYAGGRALFEESLAIRRELGDKAGIATSLLNLGSVTFDQSDYTAARTLFEEGLSLFQELEDRWGIAFSLCYLGDVMYVQGDSAAARTLYEESLAIRRETGDKRGIASSLNNLGDVIRDQGDDTAARALYEESLAIRREMGDNLGIAFSLLRLGSMTHSQGDFTDGQALLAESLSLFWKLGDRKGVTECLESLAALWAGSEALKAVRLWGATQTLRELLGAPLPVKAREEYELQMARIRSALGADAFAAAWAAGHALSLEQAVAYALKESPCPN